MPIVRLTSANHSLTCGNVTLTQTEKEAEVSEALALKFFDTGKVEIICRCDADGNAVGSPFKEDEVKDVTDDAIDVDTVEAELSACSKVADFEAMAKKYNIDISGCTNKQQRKDAILAAFNL